MDLDRAQAFADAWVADWNSHDLDRIMTRYADDVVFRSPLAARLVEGSHGVIRGSAALRAYWAEGLRRNPGLHFDLLGVYAGVDCVVINFRHQDGRRSCEVLVLDGDLVVSGWGTHAPPPT
ncbi:nuclear transport factor 2 family protein [Sphaerisporangium sp. NPDC005288]|uniref:nuclear transport factor 2 family protein n=1 Tax=Sphaerisporangium sp. NPDC005288 TaxID=3155114 RepID=UPI0033B0454C